MLNESVLLNFSMITIYSLLVYGEIPLVLSGMHSCVHLLKANYYIKLANEKHAESAYSALELEV